MHSTGLAHGAAQQLGWPRHACIARSQCQPARSPRPARRRWRGTRRVHIGLGAAHPAGRARGRGGGCVGQHEWGEGSLMRSGDDEG
jgi:hypothetical protein